MLRKWNRFLAVLLAIAMIATTFNSNVSNIRVYAETEGAPENSSGDEPNTDPPVVDPPTVDPPTVETPVVDPPVEDPPAGDPPVVDTPTDEDQKLLPPDGSKSGGSPEDPEEEKKEDPEEEKKEEPEEEKKEEPEDEEEELPPAPVKTITISYVANEGGSVSIPSDTIPEDGEASEVRANADTGYAFVNWTDGSTVVCGSRTFRPAGELLVDGATYYANFVKSGYTVSFKVDGSDFDTRGFSSGETLTIPSQDPFKAGYFFRGWNYNGSLITHDNASDYTVTGDMVLEAELEEIKIFEVTVKYYYISPGGTEVPFDNQIVEVEKSNLPVTITSPPEVQVAEDEAYPVYYPKETSIQITTADLDDIKDTRQEGSVIVGILNDRSVQYIPFEFTFWYTYLLKDLEGGNYTKVQSIPAQGVKNTVVTPKVIDIPGGEFERTESYTVTVEGQELPVYYTRANYRLEFDSNGGSYVDAVTAPYETVIDISEKEPTYAGYTFGGWYTDEALTTAADDNYKLEKDTTLYAKWDPATVNYTLVYTIENANDTEYSYIGIATATAQVGSSVKATASSPKPAELDLDNFTFKESNEKTVLPDGSTTITVKYSRNVYKIKYSGSGGIYGNTLEAKYGSDITDSFSRIFNEGYSSEYAWSFTNVDRDKFVIYNTMPGKGESGITWIEDGKTIKLYRHNFSTDATQILNYWLENYGPEAGQVTFEGKKYGLFQSTTVHFKHCYDYSEFPEIAGYTKNKFTTWAAQKKKGLGWEDINKYITFTLGTGSYNSGTATENYKGLRFDFYYFADSYPLTFNNYDGTLISTEQIALGSDISGKITAAEALATPPTDDADWDGWYTDSYHSEAYAGDNKMPTGLVLYANWIIPQRHITFVKVDPVTGQQTVIETKAYDHNKTASSITPAAIDGFTFGGWYIDSDYSEKYDFNKPLTQDISVYTYWIPDEISYTVKFIYYEDGEEMEAAPSRTERSPAFQPGDKKVVKAASVVGMLPDATEKEIILTNGENVVTFVYQHKPENLTYTVRYIFMDGGNEIRVAPDYTPAEPLSGSQASVTVAAVEADPDYMRSVPEYASYADRKYYPEEVVKTHIFTYTDTQNVITFYYHDYKMGKIVVNFVDMDGNSIADTVEKSMMPGGQYTINTSLGGYVFNYIKDESGQIVDSPKVIATSGTITRTVYYQKKLVIGANGKTKTYDGRPLVSTFTAEDYYVEGLVDGHRITALSFTGSQTEVGESKTTPFGAQVSTGQSGSDYYIIEYKSGTLTVTALEGIVVNIAADNINIEYDGQSHTAKYTIESITNPAFKADYIGHTGDIEITSKDVIDQQLAAHFFVKEEYAHNFANVTINVAEGGLTITPKKLTVTTPTVITTYPEPATSGTLSDADARGAVQGWVAGDGGKLGSLSGIKYNVIDEDDLVEGDTHYYENKVGDPAIIFDSGTNADNYIIDTVNYGKLIVKPRPITVQITGHISDPDPIVFDGKPHTVSGYEADVLSEVPADRAYRTKGATLDYEGPSQGSVKVTQGSVGKYYLGLDESQFTNINPNYDVTFVVVDGYLDIVAAGSIVVRVTGNSDTVIYDGTPQSVTGYEMEIITDDSGLYTLDKVTGPAQSAAIATGTAVGKYDMTLAEGLFSNSDPNFEVSFEIVNGTLNIEKAKIEVEVTGNTDTVTYDGTPKSITGYTIDGVWLTNGGERKDATALYTAFEGPSQEEAIAAGTNARQEAYPMNLSEDSFVNTDKANFDVTFTVTNGWLQINKLPVTVTITGNSDVVEYNGEEQSVSGYTAQASSDLYLDDYYNGPAQDGAKVTAKGTNADTYTMEVTADDFAVNSNEANGNFDVTFDVTPGTLTINPFKDEMIVHVKGNSATEVYDGTLKTIDGFEKVGTVDETITVALAEGKAAHAEGTDANAEGYMMNLVSGDFVATSPNYENITVVLDEDGKLIITPAKDRKVPTATGFEGPYDGQTHTVTVSEDGRIAGDEIIFTYVDTADQAQTVEATSAPVIKNVSESIGFVTVTIKNKNYEDAVLEAVPLNIFKRDLTVTTPTARKKYDGTPLTAEGSISGLVGGDTVDFATTGTVTRPDVVTNTYTLAWTTGNEGNYNLVENLGTLTVYDRPDDEKFIIYATPLDGGSIVYDGQEKTDFDYTISWEVGGTEAAEIDATAVAVDQTARQAAEADEGIFARAGRAIRETAENVVEFVADLFTIKSDAREKADDYSDGARSYHAVVDAEVIADRTAKDVGEYVLSMDEATLTNFKVTDAEGEDVSNQFKVVAKGTASLEITPAPVTVTADNKSKTTAQADPAFTAKVEAENTDLNAEAAETVKYTLSRTGGNDVGTYPITAAGEELQGNFKVTYVPGQLVITAAGGGGGDPTPTPTPTPIVDEPTPTAPTPAPAAPVGAVLGATREQSTDGAAVLGARRGRTDDETTSGAARVMIIILSAAAAIVILLKGKRKEDQ
ncbi:InlB B-repeat-containing protein [Butyrivibrio sp. FCS014]|uniref:InlB B-repeat-containing protein n=1 Tax=Butyrivibrio sp. FCS014 TaxID=1408304 RepID=UPI00046396A6|nr:InlB B-repeat-containing protein [Butyrivibrio sp. FCS014]